jgi:methylated-DNA-[protein]-cysteine S-methyltransferase
MNRAQWLLDSAIGPMYLVASEKGLQGVFWKSQQVTFANSLDSNFKEIKILAQTKSQLDEYLIGQRKVFDIPFDVEGTAFQRQVWEELTKIPYGKTVSYTELACRIKKETAVRAVGSANAKNPLCVFVPCHRVIAADGSLGGYSGGLEIKAKLLELERLRSSNHYFASQAST